MREIKRDRIEIFFYKSFFEGKYNLLGEKTVYWKYFYGLKNKRGTETIKEKGENANVY